ncbi:MAG: DNA polymerase III subunit chi [Ideonella sp.]|nr:DNA polymerase III subunit chi [Ideonella sp.]
MAVFGPPPLLARLDQLLWTEDAGREFTLHTGHRAAVQAVAQLGGGAPPIWLLDAPEPSVPWTSAVNLGLDPEMLLGFERVAELVGIDPEEAQAGRARWRQYAALGLKFSITLNLRLAGLGHQISTARVAGLTADAVLRA